MSASENRTDNNLLQAMGFIFGFHGRITRTAYAVVGFGVMGTKYAGEALLIFFVTGKILNPLIFATPSLLLRDGYYSAGPAWLPWVIAIGSIPFAWLAVTLSVRRAIDAGHSPWVGLWMLCPLANLMAMVYLAIVPTAVPRRDGLDQANQRDKIESIRKVKSSIFSAFLGILVGSLFALAITIASVYPLDNYGSALFIGMPVVSGVVAGYVFNQLSYGSWISSTGVGMLSVSVGGFGLLVFALEGAICLVMAMPLIVPLGGLGGFLGWLFAKTIALQSRWMLGGALFVVPFLTAVEKHLNTYQVEVVESSVIIDASRETVWNNVVSFPDITKPAAWYFRLGVATPLRAQIEGTGVGAVRNCEFTTGNFVEPITIWKEPSHLAFDVADQPDPLIELTPYRNVRPPHMQHSFRSVKGEFRLIELEDGRTKLTGRTWYTIDMGPRLYWRFWTDEIIHRIHLRVLEHIRDNAEKRNGTLPQRRKERRSRELPS